MPPPLYVFSDWLWNRRLRMHGPLNNQRLNFVGRRRAFRNVSASTLLVRPVSRSLLRTHSLNAHTLLNCMSKVVYMREIVRTYALANSRFFGVNRRAFDSMAAPGANRLSLLHYVS